MCAKWHNDFDPAALLAKLGTRAKVTNGKASFEGFEIGEWQAIIDENISLHDEIPSIESSRIVWKALTDCALSTNFSAQFFLRAASVAEGTYLSQPLKQFYLMTSLSIQFEKDLVLPAFHGCRLILSRAFPKKFDRKPIESNLRWDFRNRPLPENYTQVRVAVRGRTAEEAGVKSVNSIDLTRSLINFQINLTKGARWFSGRPQAINLVAAGPISTLHERAGKLADEMWWFEPDYIEPAKLIESGDLKKKRQNEVILLRLLRSHPYRKELETLFRQYSRALDELNYDYAIIKLWSVLERLMATDRYETVTRRVAFLYPDFEHHRSILNHIRRYRNRIIHGGHSSSNRNEIIHQLRSYVQVVLLFHLNKARGEKSIAERVQLLDLPFKLTDLRKKRRLIDFAIRFRRG